MEDTVIQPTGQAQQPISQPTPRKKQWIIVSVLVVLLIILLTIFILSKKDATGKPTAAKLPFGAQLVTPTPFPFQELTIPYLREQTYVSSLGSLIQEYSGNGYSAYTTSYTSDGLTIHGLLTKPSGEMPVGGWPAIVFVHGYIPPTQYSTTGEAYFAYVDYLAENGFVVFKIDLRGHGTSEGEPGGGYYGSDYVTDTLNAYGALQASDFVHPEKIGLWGHSMAGNATLRSAVVKTDIPATVIWAGAVFSYIDQREYGINDNSYQPPQNITGTQRQNRRRELFEKNGSPSAQSVFWQQVAPTNYLNELKGAIELHHAVDDAVVNIGYSRDLDALLDKTAVLHKLHEYESGGHNIAGGNFTLAMQRTVDFFKQYLQ